MAVGESIRDTIRKYREDMVDELDPIHSEERVVQEYNRSLYTNITARSRDLLGIEVGDDVEIHSYRGFAVIVPSDNGVSEDEQ